MCKLFDKKDYHFLSDKKINEEVYEKLKGVGATYKGVIISGYPNNLVQLDYIQKCGILPDRYFVLTFDSAKLAAKYQETNSEKDTESLMQRNRMELQEL